MSLTISYVGPGPYAGNANSTISFDLTGLPTGVGLILEVDQSYNANVISGPSLSTDSVQSASSFAAKKMYVFVSNCSAAAQTLTINKESTYCEIGITIWSVTGHNTSDMFGNENSALGASSINMTMEASGNGLLMAYGPYVGEPSGGGTWGTQQSTGGYGQARTSPCNSNTGGTISLGGSTDIHVVEIKAAAGGGGSNIIRGVKGMTGGMQNLSGGTQ